MSRTSAVKSFAMTNMLLETDLTRIEERYGIDLGRFHRTEADEDEDFYPQFQAALRLEAKQMAEHYEVFYCLEKTIRELISDVFIAAGEEDWWENKVPQQVRENAKKSIKREKEAAVTPRSSNPIDYTNFGELGEIIKSNWGLFGGSVFTDVKAVEKVMSNLNSLRNPIAHCSPLAGDEVLRLKLSLKDWFRIIA